MARSRNIKPGLFTNELLGTADPYLTILFEGLWCEADREGRLEDRPLKINARIFPYRGFSPKKIEAMLGELTALGFIRRYKVGEVGVIQVVNFVEHQSPHSTEKESKLPPEPVVEMQLNQLVSESTKGLALDNESTAEVECIGNQESGNQESVKPVEQIFAYWQDRTKHPRASLTVERRRAIKDRLANYSVPDIQAAIDGCLKSPYHMGLNDKNTVYDDIELICRNDTKLEKFIALNDGVKNGSDQKHSGYSPKSNLGALEQSANYFESKYGTSPDHP